jgi:hypothetical protein
LGRPPLPCGGGGGGCGGGCGVDPGTKEGALPLRESLALAPVRDCGSALLPEGWPPLPAQPVISSDECMNDLLFGARAGRRHEHQFYILRPSLTILRSYTTSENWRNNLRSDCRILVRPDCRKTVRPDCQIPVPLTSRNMGHPQFLNRKTSPCLMFL